MLCTVKLSKLKVYGHVDVWVHRKSRSHLADTLNKASHVQHVRLPRVVMLLFLDSILLDIHSINRLCSSVLDVEFLSSSEDAHVLDMDFDDKLTAYIVVAQIVAFNH